MDKDTEKKKDKLRQMSEDLRRKAVETQEALDFAQNANDVSEASIERQRKQIEETNEKLRLQLQLLADTKAKLEAKLKASKRSTSTGGKPRSFAKPTSSEEAEGDVPSAEVRAEGFIFKGKDEILQSGTLREKIRLYFCFMDDDNYFGSKSSLTPKEISKITASIKTDQDRKEVEHYYREYRTISRYGSSLRYFFKRFQTSFACLAKHLYKLDLYEAEIDTYNTILATFLAIPSSGTGGSLLHYPTEEAKREAVNKLAENLHNVVSKYIAGETILFDRDKMEFRLILSENGLLSDIQKEAKDVEETLADFKAYAVVAEEYVKKSKLRYLPISIQMCIENAEEERYIRYLVENLRYFQSELNYRKSKGEDISEEDYKRAFIPDYFEVEPSKDVLKDCKEGIKQIEKSMRL